MDVVIATPALAGPGGAQSYALTAGEHIARLGHHVTLYAHELGHVAEQAVEAGLAVAGSPAALPDRADTVITGVSQALALELAGRYPDATRLWVVHGENLHMPPAVPGVVAASVALNDRTAQLAAAVPGAGEVVRLRQPVDLRRFSPRGEPAPAPRRVLLFGNYHAHPGERATLLREAWAGADLEWRTAGWPALELDPVAAIAEADIVVGIGRCALEGMACARPVYVHDHAGSDGWITPGRYEAVEAGGFAVSTARLPPDAARLRADLEAYDPALGRAGQDLARMHHDARRHAADLVALAERLAPEPFALDRSATRALMLLAEAQIRAETAAERYRIEARQWAARFQTLHREHEEERIAWVAERDEERAAATRRQAEAATEAGAEAERRLAALKATRRYKLGAVLARPLDRLRRGR